MLKAIAHHLLTDAQPVPQQWPPASFPQLYMLSIMPHGMEHPLGPLGSTVPAVSLHNSLCPSILPTDRA